MHSCEYINHLKHEKKQPTFTIVTVSFNCKTTIEKTILSVLQQDFTDYEYIVIDGGSTDGTTDIIRKYESRLAYWCSEPDKGIYDGMNKGVKEASGEWICIYERRRCDAQQ